MNALALERLHLQRMPGIRPGFELGGLSPGLNVVHGPNASGKTTTARAIEALLWPAAASDHAWISASARLDGEAWTIGVDGRRARWQREGADAAPPVLPPPEARDRYRLSLHELLTADDVGFAHAIARESAGGYDLAAAARALDPRTAVPPRRKELEALKEARAKLSDASAAQERLRGEERRLRDLSERIAGRERLESRLRLLDLAIEHARAREAEARAAALVATFDARMERVRGNEAEQLKGIARKLADAREEGRSAEKDRERAEAALAACDLPAGGLPPGLLPALRQALDALCEQERRTAGLEQALRAAQAQRERAQRAIGDAVDPDRLRELRTDGVEALAEFTLDAEKVAAERAALEAGLAELSDGAGPGESRETLDRGVLFLRRWLQGGPAGDARGDRLRRLALVAAAGLTATGLALGMVHPVLASTALAGVVLLVLVLRVGAEAGARPVHQAEFGKLGLRAPGSWTVDAVEARLSELERDLAAARVAEERARIREQVAARLAALEPREWKIAARRERIAHELGVDPHSPNGLAWLVERISRWHEAAAAAEGAEAALATARRQMAAGLADAAARVGSAAGVAVPDVATLAGALASLEERQRRFEIASGQHALALEKRAAVATAVETLEGERAGVFAAVGLEEMDLALVEGWCAEHARFRESRDDHRVATAQREALADRLAAAPDPDPSLLTGDEPVLAERAAACRTEAEEVDRLRDEATAIRTRIEDAKRAHDVEEALAGVTACEDALRAARAKDMRSTLAEALVGYVQDATRDQHLPRVFHRARQLFAGITHGRYELRFDDGDTPAFRALDTTTGAGHPLDELSSASRIQLLLAVRLAFVETQEQGIRLPLLLDETLGNSDDERAEAIMAALVELAGQGRQIFYFTAQPDEVGKWKGLVERVGGEPCAFVDLAAARRIERRVALPGLRVVAAPKRAIPSPDGLTHAQYGAELAVPALDPFGTADAAHLWYLVEEPCALHHLLAELRVERWGALRLLAEQGAGSLIDPSLLERIRSLARALETALELARIGRGRPIDRPEVEASGAISDRFMDAVVDLCRRSGGDARRVMEALEGSEIRRFHAKSREAFREFLEANGHLDPRDPLDPEELRAHVLASVADEIDRGALAMGDVDRLLARMGAFPAVPLPENPVTIAP